MGVRNTSLLAPVLLLVASACTEPAYDLVIENGRVMDPETGFFEVASVGINGGTIIAVSAESMEGMRVIDATGHVVAPGFVDLHEHGNEEVAYGLMVRDGVTTALELEVGTGDVDAWYAARAGGERVNYGVSIGHVQVRMDVMGDPGTGLVPVGVGGHAAATDEQIAEMDTRIRAGLDRGAVAVGFGSAYTPGATMAEIQHMFGIAGEYGTTIHIHMRSGLAGLDSTIAAARAADAPLHIVHVNSSAGAQIQDFLEHIEAARASGQDVSTETYPYGAGMTEITSALYDDWETWSDDRFQRIQLVSTGARATRSTFGAAREAGGYVISHGRSEEMTAAAVASPLTMIASDGFMVDGRGHPRTSGTYAKILGRYVREEGLLTLEEAVAKMTIQPARRLESRAPAFARKGRLQPGMDADVTVFDPATVIDRSTYVDAAIPSAGIPFVIVDGVVVVDQGDLSDARPGRPMRAPIR
jgi:N-acyl-D-aspartate/D-glutamate deacylase